MINILSRSGFFCMALTVTAFCIGTACQKKWKKAIFNPIMIGAILVILVLWWLDIPVEKYQQDCKPLTYLTTPATICLTIAFFEHLQKLKIHLPAIIIGVTGGTLSSLLSVLVLSRLFEFSNIITNSLLPKSITSAIGGPLAELIGGIPAICTAAIILTGILGNMLGPVLCKFFHFTSPVVQGVSYGSSAHVIGTAKANEVSALTGAVSSLSLVIAGLLTAILLPILSKYF